MSPVRGHVLADRALTDAGSSAPARKPGRGFLSLQGSPVKLGDLLEIQLDGRWFVFIVAGFVDLHGVPVPELRAVREVTR